MTMKKTGPVILITCLIGNTSAQTWDLMETPAAARHYTYYMEVDASESRFVLFARNSSVDSVYTSNGEGNWAGVQHGDFPKAFYADDGSLFLLKDLNPSSSVLQPQVFRSTDNGVTLSEITGVAGRCFYKDAQGNIFLSTPTGFKYSTNSGVSFTDVATPFAVTGAALDGNGDLYYGSDSLKLFHSVNGGSTWSDISKNLSAYARVSELQVVNGTYFFNDEDGSHRYGAPADPIWSFIQPGTLTSWVGDLRFHDDALFIRSPYGLYSRTTWAPSGWPLILEGIFSSNSFGSFLGNYSLSNDHVFAKVDSGFVTTSIAALVSTAEIDAAPLVKVFPNPATDVLFVSGFKDLGMVALELHDPAGCLVRRVRGKASVDVRDLPAGAYVLTMTEGGRRHAATFMKE
ncbi:MAG: T9SS type A sorting domain-containing protein [Flavobacteriales bacterium]|jgi:hypothetical protein|nr:T9SS type A sorting domain-containing protein [Flavobacteriales bacterium]MBK7112076.1 T9SS type A sorting domain-containing protein [Flavobacteriales bacterium]HQW04476.1 T9SS type A sorting domain-containing protein [Flavobacteriales bacterium]HQW98348.1 T9SS type A sorting domain-containing protein [Flavobacteriales bacterium]